MAEHQHKPETTEYPDTLGGRIRKTMTHIGDNIDLVNFFGRQKDYYKLFEFSVPFMASGFIWLGSKMSNNPDLANLSKELQQANASIMSGNPDLNTVTTKLKLEAVQQSLQKKANAKAGLVADTMNGITLMSIALISNWIEKRDVEQIYGDYVKEELGLSRDATFRDLRKSNNPIIQDTADYYARKIRYRTLPNLLSFGRLIPAVVQLLDRKGYDNPDKHKWAKGIAEKWDGTKASMAGWAGYFSWYIVSRQTGSHYELKRIWDKTEGFNHLPNRALNRGAQPGEEITNSDINALYGQVVQESHEKDSALPKLIGLSRNDPLTDRLFTQIADYLNYNYIPKLMASKRGIELNDPNFAGTRFSFRDLVHLMGTAGVNVNNAMTTALKIETLARRDRKTYDTLSKRLDAIPRPEGRKFATVQQATQAMHNYLDTLEGEAKAVLGEEWPPQYIRDIRFRDAIVKAFLENEMGAAPKRPNQEPAQEHPRQREAAPEKTFATNFPQAENHVKRSQTENLAQNAAFNQSF